MDHRIIRHSRYAGQLFIFLLFIFSFFLLSCEIKKPFKIGYIGGLTGRVADLGIAGRDGALLAVEEINHAGGIQGRPVELLIKDDGQDPGKAVRGVEELISEGAIAIIGHMTSAMSIATVPVINEKKIVMISPTTSTNELTARDDYFFRVYPASEQASKHLAYHVAEDMGLKRVTIVYDEGNKAYTESAYLSFKKEFEQKGGTIVDAYAYTSGPDTVFSDLAERVTARPTDILFILANAMDTAMLCQQLKKSGKLLPVITGEWSVTEEVIHFGGRAVEGIHFFHTFDKTNTNLPFLNFKEMFARRFGYEAGFASAHAYDATQVLFRALEKNNNPALLKETIHKIGSYEGLQGTLELDRFGDVNRRHFLMTIRDGRFQTIH